MLYFLWFIIILFFIIDLIGAVLPAFPDALFYWLAILLYRFTISQQLSFSFWVGAILLTFILYLADYLAGVYFIKKEGGSTTSLIAAALGLIVGSIFFPPFGVVIGPFLMVFVVEYWKYKDKNNALRIARGTLFAFFSSTVMKIILQLVMVGWFFLEIF